jgi:uncharacterized protein (TIGR02646 family)
MRCLPERMNLTRNTCDRLHAENVAVIAAANPEAEAEKRYGAARKAAWFRPVIRSLVILSGLGQRCMYCSGSESSQVEHYRPKSTSPELAFEWNNLIWVCGICNQAKGNRFEKSSVAPINPLTDNPWDYFFIDQFGNLTPKWDAAIDDFNLRGKWTIELMSLDRQALQECRQERLEDLRIKVRDALKMFNAGLLHRDELELRVLRWLEQPFQPDIADYFIAGPGGFNLTEQFTELIETLGG